jgi:hypothetical protein
MPKSKRFNCQLLKKNWNKSQNILETKLAYPVLLNQSKACGYFLMKKGGISV